MSSHFTQLFFKFIKRVDAELFGVDPPRNYPKQGQTTAEQWEAVPVLKRGIEWDAEGRMFIHEIKQCPITGLKVRITREIVG